MTPDRYGRTFKKLRVSLTHECNYACLYCADVKEKIPSVPSDNRNLKPTKRMLSMSELLRIIEKLHKELDLEMVRFTGGEPLLYPKIDTLVAEVKKLGINKVTMTTNGHVLFNKIEDLEKAGLDGVNISLDAIDPIIFKEMSRFNGLHNVLKSIHKASESKMEVKLNTVILRGKNQDQLLHLLDFALQKGIVIRFLELMAMGPLKENYKELFFPEKDMLEIISKIYSIEPGEKEKNATAHYWNINGKKAFGIIANHSTPFCGDCNRLRLDSYGHIYGCLSSLKAIDILEPTNSAFLKEALSEALRHKQTHFIGNKRTMQSIGG